MRATPPRQGPHCQEPRVELQRSSVRRRCREPHHQRPSAKGHTSAESCIIDSQGGTYLRRQRLTAQRLSPAQRSTAALPCLPPGEASVRRCPRRRRYLPPREARSVRRRPAFSVAAPPVSTATGIQCSYRPPCLPPRETSVRRRGFRRRSTVFDHDGADDIVRRERENTVPVPEASFRRRGFRQRSTVFD